MMRPRRIGFLVLALALAASACSRHTKLALPRDEVLIYDLPYDLVYLRTFEALENVAGWEVEETEKEKGIIQIRNVHYSRFDDSDLRLATVLVKRLNRDQTSVALAPQSQRVLGAGDLLERISQYVSREI